VRRFQYGFNSSGTESGQPFRVYWRSRLSTGSCRVVVCNCYAVTGSDCICPMLNTVAPWSPTESSSDPVSVTGSLDNPSALTWSWVRLNRMTYRYADRVRAQHWSWQQPTLGCNISAQEWQWGVCGLCTGGAHLNTGTGETSEHHRPENMLHSPVGHSYAHWLWMSWRHVQLDTRCTLNTHVQWQLLCHRLTHLQLNVRVAWGHSELTLVRI